MPSPEHSRFSPEDPFSSPSLGALFFRYPLLSLSLSTDAFCA